MIADFALKAGKIQPKDVEAIITQGTESEPRLWDALDNPSEIKACVDSAIAQAGGDPVRALAERGTIDRSLMAAAARSGVSPAILPLRQVAPERYRSFELLSGGGMGLVYSAYDTELNREVALKAIRPGAGTGHKLGAPDSPFDIIPPPPDSQDAATYAEIQSRFLQEVWITAGLEHPGVIPVHDIGITPAGTPYYTMQLVRGEATLATAIRNVRDKGIEERLTLLEPFLKVCDAAFFAHVRGIVHRDLKPSNIGLGKFGEVFILDWGLAKLKNRPDLSAERWQQKIQSFHDRADLDTDMDALGTPGYMAPEAALGYLEQVTTRSDVYSLGVILYEILTGRPPYPTYVHFVSAVNKGREPPPPHKVRSDVPRSLSRRCASCLRLEKADRMHTAKRLARSIRHWQARSALERELEGLLEEAHAAMDGARRHRHVHALPDLDRAIAAARQVLKSRPDDKNAAGIVKRAKALREQCIQAREHKAKSGVLARATIIGLAVATITAVVVAGLLESRRAEADRARTRAEDAERQAREALASAKSDQDAKAAALAAANESRMRERETNIEVRRALAGEEAATRSASEALARERRARQAADQALKQAAKDRDAKARALADVLSLADAKRARDLLDERDELWPLHPDCAPAMAEWTRRARVVLSHRGGHANALAQLRKRARPGGRKTTRRAGSGRVRKALTFTSAGDEWRYQVLSDLLEALDGLALALPEIAKRHRLAKTLRARSIDAHRMAWDLNIKAIEASRSYGGLRLTPQIGLVPLGIDPDSGLFEFAHLDSGEVPERDAKTSRLRLDEDSAVVLVLIPGGTFRMGAQKANPAAPNYDPGAAPNERPVHKVTLSPYFISKYECTQAQWARLTGGQKPSCYRAGSNHGGKWYTSRHPVEQVSWEESTRWLRRHGLDLPTEAQWEFACRGGTDTPWITGRKAASIAKVANIADAYLKKHGGPPEWRYCENLNDGFAAHAPVGSFAPNAFGLHDVHGNVWEWCRDTYGPYEQESAADPLVQGKGQRVYRGGGWGDPAGGVRVTIRYPCAPTVRNAAYGIRPARPITTQ